MQTYTIIIEDRAECDDKMYNIKAESIEEAKKTFCKAFMPLLEFPYENLESMLNNEDVYLHIIKPNNVFNL